MSRKSPGSNSVDFSRYSAESNAVSWSQDQRIAVAAAESIYVVTLKRPTLPQKKSSKEAAASSSVILSTSPSEDSRPLVSITYASAPLKDKLDPLNLEEGSEVPTSSKDPKLSLDPVLSRKGNYDQIRSVQWSPVGFNKDGGCVLTALTVSGRLLLYTPPGCTALTWKQVDLSPNLAPLLLSQPESLSQAIDCEPPNGDKKLPNPKDPKYKKTGSKKNAKTSKCQAEEAVAGGNNGGDSVEGSKPKRAKLSAILTKEATDVITLHKLAVATTACSWLPTWLLLPGGKVVGVIALATRGGQLALIGVKLPISAKRADDEATPTLLCYSKLPFSTSDSSVWCSSLLWLPAPPIPSSFSSTSSSSFSSPPPSFLSPSSSGNAQGRLIAGCTNGQVFCLQVLLRGVATDNGGGSWLGSIDRTVTSVSCVGGIDQIGACIKKATPIWEEPDLIPVHSMACHSQFSDGALWVAFAKSSVVMAAKLNSSYKQVGPCVQVDSLHTMTVSGVAACSSTSFVTSSLDGSLQTFSLDSSSIRDNHVSPSPVAVEIPEGVVASQGVASSETGLLIAVAMNFSTDYLKGPRKPAIKLSSRLNFITITTENHIEELIKSQPSGKWDVCEYLRRHYAEHQAVLTPVKDLWGNLTKGRCLSFNKLRLLLHANIIMGKKEETERCRRELAKRHAVYSLRNWVEWEKKNIEKKGSEKFMDSQSTVCLQLMAGWLLSTTTSQLTITDTRLANRILEEYPIQSLDNLSSKKLPPLELCPACSEPVPLKNLLYAMCGRGHRWSRCGLTMMLAADARCSSCLQCGSTANNTITMDTTSGGWLDSLLRQHSCCVYCGGYFEQVV